MISPRFVLVNLRASVSNVDCNNIKSRPEFVVCFVSTCTKIGKLKLKLENNCEIVIKES